MENYFNNTMPDVFTENESLRRRRALLDALSQQNQQTPIVGNTGLGQALAKLATAYITSKGQRSIDSGFAENRNQYNQQLGGQLNDYLNIREGERLTNLPGPPTQGGMPPQDIQRPGNPREAITRAMISQFPEMRDIGKQDYINLGKQELETYGQPVSEIDPNTKQLISVRYGNRNGRQVVPGAMPFEKPLVINDQVVPANTPPGTDLRTKYTPRYEYKGDSYVNEDRPGGKPIKIDNAPRINLSNIGNSVQKGETALSQELGKDVAAEFKDARDAAKNAYTTLGSLQQMKALENSGIFSGPITPVATALAGFAQSLGIPISKDDSIKLGNSQAFQQQFAKQIARVMLTGSIGRSMTDPDRKRFEETLPSLIQSPQGRAQIYAQLESAANTDITRHKSLQSRLIKAFPDYTGLLTLNPVDSSPGRGVKSPEPPVVTPQESSQPLDFKTYFNSLSERQKAELKQQMGL